MRKILLAAVLAALSLTTVASASHIPGMPCKDCASHAHWPTIDGLLLKAPSNQAVRYVGTGRSDQLLGHFKSDRLYGKDGSDVLWGSWQGVGQPLDQRDYISGGGGSDFIYAGHGHNTVYGGAGNDAISIHYGRGFLDCGPGRDIYHVARTPRRATRSATARRSTTARSSSAAAACGPCPESTRSGGKPHHGPRAGVMSTARGAGDHRDAPIASSSPDAKDPAMPDTKTLRKAVDHARRKHAVLAQDRVFGDGQLGDAELVNLLVVAYPTVVGQRN
jgi:Ca2+-binding RTX toxin-like protein